jgi:regulator of protease activity HflC (stomatin/prohibitin superfamily)
MSPLFYSKEKEKEIYMSFVIIVVVLVLCILFASMHNVRPDTVCIVERMGKYYQTWEPGMHVCVPIVDKIAATVQTKVQYMESSDQPVISSDNEILISRYRLSFQITDPHMYHYSAANTLVALEMLGWKVIREVFGNLSAEYIRSNYDEVRKHTVLTLFDAAEQFGVGIVDFEYETFSRV